MQLNLNGRAGLTLLLFGPTQLFNSYIFFLIELYYFVLNCVCVHIHMYVCLLDGLLLVGVAHRKSSRLVI